MKFIISRVSGETPPCEGAVSEEVTHTYQRKCRSSDKSNVSLFHYLKKNNPTYRVENGVHKWEVILKKWIIEINTLEELVALQEKVGRLILSEHLHLEIYDDYIE